MKTLHKYLVGQVIAALLLTVAVFVFIVLLLNALKDVLPLLFGGQASLWLVLKAVSLLLPFACVYALPMGFITATLLVFGRFSADQELTAARAGGVSLLALISPVLLLSLFCCGLSAWFNMEIGPRSRVAFLELRRGLISEMANAQLPAGRFINDFPGYMFYVKKNDGGLLKEVTIYKIENETNVVATVRAPEGRLSPDRASNQLILQLTDPRIFKVDAQGRPAVMAFSTLDVNLSPTIATNKSSKPQIGDMTFSQLRQELRNLEKLNLKAGAGTNSAEQMKSQLAAMKKQKKDMFEPVRVAMHRQIAFSFACFGFTLVGIPLGIRVHRRETNIGIAIALGLVLAYYAFIMLGLSLSGKPEFYPHLILWVPNFLFQAVGAVLLWRANRGI